MRRLLIRFLGMHGKAHVRAERMRLLALLGMGIGC